MSDKAPALDLASMRDDLAGEESPLPVSPIAKLVPRSIPLDLDYTDPEGRNHKALVTTQILSGDERIRVGRMTAALTGNVPWENLPPAVRDIAYMLSWVTHSLQEPPSWLTQWLQNDVLLLQLVYQEVQTHEERYFLGDVAEGDAAEAEPRIRVNSPASADPKA